MDTGVIVEYWSTQKLPGWDANQQVDAISIRHPDASIVKSLVVYLKKLGWHVWIVGTCDGTPAAYMTKPGKEQ